MPAAFRQIEFRPSAPTTSRAEICVPCVHAQPGVAWRELDALDICGIERGHAVGGLRVQHVDEHAVGDVVAEGVEAKLACPEFDVRRAKQAARGIDDANGLERRGMGQDRLPDAKRLQHVDRAFQKRRGPRVERLRAVGQGGRGAGPISATREPPWASASAVARPVGPVPTTAMSMSIASAKICSQVDVSEAPEARPRPADL